MMLQAIAAQQYGLPSQDLNQQHGLPDQNLNQQYALPISQPTAGNANYHLPNAGNANYHQPNAGNAGPNYYQPNTGEAAIDCIIGLVVHFVFRCLVSQRYPQGSQK